MDNRIILGVIGNGRSELLDGTIQTLLSNVNCDFYKKIMINDTGNQDYHNYLTENYGDIFEIISHSSNQGLSGSIMSLWDRSSDYGFDYIFHVEEDFLFNFQIDIFELVSVLNADPNLAQIALKRQPVNDFESSIGGFMNADPSSYQKHCLGNLKWLSHRNFFTLNPSLYPRWVVEVGWQNGWGEKEFADLLFSNEQIVCGFLGDVEDEPLVFHTGTYRAANWML